DVFLSHFEWMLEGGVMSTIGKIIKPRLETRSEFLLESGERNPTKHVPDKGNMLEGEVVSE
ncbi:MAG: hypothetical protein L0287_00635, partial [Anaerolineae bacterium]|nr:hypothetical protein [Anaerolineae bacterium]